MELEPENNLVHFFSTTLRKGEAWANAYAESEAQGHTLLPQPDFEMVQIMVAAIGKNQQCNKLRNAPNGKRELSVFAEHKPTGQLIKCRADLFVPDYGSKGGVLVDLKTCARAGKTLFSKDAFEYGYHIQAAHYMLVCRAAGLQVGHFFFAVVEKSKPYATNFLIVEPDLLDRATVIVEQTLREIKAYENNPNPTTGWPSWSYLKTPWWMKENSKTKEKNH